MAVAGGICKRTLSNVAASITEEAQWTSNQICQMPCRGCVLRKLSPRNRAEVCVTMARSQRHCNLKTGNVNLYCVSME